MHGVIFDDKHTYRDWGLLLKSMPKISPPEPKTKLVELPLSDAVIDLTEVMTGKVHYQLRSLEFEFVTMEQRSRWTALHSDIVNAIHGKRVRIIMDDDPNFYYIGRVTVGELKPEKKTAVLSITAKVEPYKRERFGNGVRL